MILDSYKQYCKSTPQPVKLVVGGRDVEKYIKDFNLSGEDYLRNIQFTGWIDHEDLPAIYSMAELYLYPSNLETFPIPLTEAMACGTPIITSDVNGLKEIAGDAALFVNNKNPEEIASAINTILNNSDMKQQLSEKGLERSKYFNWKKCATEILDLINHFKEVNSLSSESIELVK